MLYPPATWRLILSPPADGATNMAVDEAILRGIAAEQAPPTLRFYGWEPPCLSLGYAQPVTDVDLTRLRANGWGLVRRPTGGRAILHTDELTYAVIAPMSEPRVLGGVIESYRQLSAGLLRGLERLGLNARAEKDYALPDRNPKGAVCFEVPSNYEITVAEKKLLGSAQVRKQRVVLQHGALPLRGDLARICDALVFHSEDQRERIKARVRQRALTVTETLGRELSWAEAAEGLAMGFAEALNLTLTPGDLNPLEWDWLAKLRAEKYGNPEWNERA